MPLLFEGLILGLSVAAPIGPTNIEMIRRGLRSGFWTCILFAAGVEVALIAYLFAVFAGLSFLTEAELFNLLIISIRHRRPVLSGICEHRGFLEPPQP